jgi:DNA-binding beta-propeller fold protein YncE
MRNTRWYVRSVYLLLGLLLILASSLVVAPRAALADDPHDFVIVINIYDCTINTIDTVTNTVYGPFLGGQLGTDGIYDVAVTHDGRTALIADFNGKKVYFVDVSDPTSPSFLGSLDMPMFIEDIDVTCDDRFAVAVDGSASNSVVSIDIDSRTIADTKTVPSYYAVAVAIACDGTVIVASDSDSKLATLTIDDTGHLTVVTTYTQGLSEPGNIGIAPDEQTVIVCNRGDDTVAVYQITWPGTLSYKGTISGLPKSYIQSVAFSQDGSKAYVLSVDWDIADNDKISVLDINGPGDVTLDIAGAATLFGKRNVFYGVETITIVGSTAYVGASRNMTDLALVDLTNHNVSNLPGFGEYPNGVDSFTRYQPVPTPPLPPPPAPGGPVGITVMPMDKAGLLLPWLGLAGLLVLGTGTWLFARRRIKR